MTDDTETKKPKGLRLTSLQVDIDAEADGEWHPVGLWPGFGELPIAFKTRGVHYEPYVRARQATMERLARKYEGADIPFAVIGEAEGKLAVEFLLVDWRGLYGDDDIEIPFSRERAMEVMMPPEGRVLRDMVNWAANRTGRRRVEFVETTAKN